MSPDEKPATPRLVVFCGPRRAGKGTCAEYLMGHLRKRGLTPRKVDFADPLREISGIVFGVSQAEFLDPVLKERPLDSWPFLSPREILQTVGTDLFRYQWPDVWLRAWQRTARQHLAQGPTAVVVTTDCRFVNEAEAVRSLDPKAMILRVTRDSLVGVDRHASEMEWSAIPFDWEVPNNGTLPDLKRIAAELAEAW